MVRIWTLVLISFCLSINIIKAETDGIELADTITQSKIYSDKQMLPLEKVASSSTTVYLKSIEKMGIQSPKEFSALVPNLYMPDYGSSMTSSIYLRGFGSRIDNPVLGLYIDDVPVMNKNAYDLEMLDIRSMDLLRGPQSTLYGRNSMCGVMSLQTLSPVDYQGFKASLEYGTSNSIKTKLSYYSKSDHLSYGLLLGYRHTDGFYTNEHTGEVCDPADAINFRYKLERNIGALNYENTISLNAIEQGGWPYRLMGGDISYNDECGYKRLYFTEGLKLTYSQANYTLNSISSYQYLLDEMRLDQDFRPISMFTMTQAQNENVITQELIFKPKGAWIKDWWTSQTGTFLFYKHNAMSAPVHFKKDGINELILANANANLPEEVGKLTFLEDNFVIGSDFGIHTYGVAFYHESYFTLNDFIITAGLRTDYEGNYMSYDSGAEVNYKYDGVMADYKALNTTYKGAVPNNYLEFLPKIAVVYDLKSHLSSDKDIKLFASISKGYKSGGFNTQIFSDILQNQMMKDLMREIGVYPDDQTPITAKNTTYKPEHSVNYELGVKSNIIDGKINFSFNAAIFYIDCLNQQITIFPPGKSTGRLMANVGKSSSYGSEIEMVFQNSGFILSANYGCTNARFVNYNDGNNDYSGNVIPYSPEYTFRANLGYEFSFNKGYLTTLGLMVDYTEIGNIFWNESNSLSQDKYRLLGSNINLGFKDFSLILRANNITNTKYDTFYFRSMENDFFQAGKPFNWSVGVTLDF